MTILLCAGCVSLYEEIRLECNTLTLHGGTTHGNDELDHLPHSLAYEMTYLAALSSFGR